jgi:TRAP-type C4-dicarboxylate transport system substrate-binding protein
MRLALLLMLVLTACGGPPPDDDRLRLVYASPYSPNHPFSRADQDWMEWVEAESEGKIQVRAIWSGALLSSDQSMIEVRHDVTDVGLITPIYAKGGAHLLRNQTGFYSGVTSQENQLAVFHCLARFSDEINRELEGLKVLAVQGGNLPGIVTRDRAVQSLDDLAGLRIRAPTELLPVLRELGAEPVSMPMGDVYSALAKGIIDGVIAPTDTFRSLHFAEVTKHFTVLQIPRGAYPGRAMSMQRWASLPDFAREILERSIEVWERALIRRTTEAVDTGAAYGAEQGVTTIELPLADQLRFLDVYSQFAMKSAAELEQFGIDGEDVYRIARASINPDGTVDCRRPN